MAINGNTLSLSRDEVRAQDPSGHAPVVISGALTANDGTYPVGLILTRASDNTLQPLAEETAFDFGTGDGATKDFTKTLGTGIPLEPGTVSITDGTETFTDDGCGNLAGDAGGTGTVNYKTGAASISFNAAPANAAAVTAGFTNAIDGVLDEMVDTSAQASGNFVAHGAVQTSALKVGVTTPADPSDALLLLLQKKGIFPK